MNSKSATQMIRFAPAVVLAFAMVLAALFFTLPADAVSKISITGAQITLNQSSYVYAGDEKKPTVTSVVLNGQTLREGSDYTVSYLYNVNAGEAVAHVVGVDKYTDAANKQFTISKRPVTIAAKSASKTYDGSPLLATAVGYTTSGLVKAADLKSVTLAGSQTNAGSCDSVVMDYAFEGEMGRNYEVTKINGKLTVNSAPLTRIEFSPSSFVYNGSQQRPTVTVYSEAGVVPSSAYDLIWPNDTTSPGEKKVTAVTAGNYSGVARGSYSITGKVPAVPMHRLYNPNSGEHFYTASDAERDELVALGWNFEGKGWNAPERSETPVHRMYNPNAGEHHYTMDEGERDALVAAGWKYEGVGWYSDDAETVPLYRDYNPNQFANNHNYTTDASEHEWLISLGWRSEGLAWYGMQG